MLISLDEAIAKLKHGEVVAIPTETVYGLAADASNEDALRQIYAIKERPADNPLIVHIASIDKVNDWAAEFPPLAQRLASAFWPGPFTLILPAHKTVSKILTAGEPTIALRVPNHALTLALLKQCDLALAAPSANKYTQLSPTTASHVVSGLGEEIPVLDGGACTIGIESTIVSIVGDDWQLLRQGMVTEEAILAIAGRPALMNAFNVPKAPGQHLLHYSPRTRLLLFKDKATLLTNFQTLSLAQLKCAALLIGEGEAPKCEVIQLANQPDQVAEQLYSALHTLDALKVDRLLVELPPDMPAWAAVRDRLIRAGYDS